MAKTQTRFVCQACGYESPKRGASPIAFAPPASISEIMAAGAKQTSSGLDEFDRVLGGPGSFKSWYNGGFTEPSLPAGFDKMDRTFLGRKGGRSDRLFPEYATRFSAAKANGTPYFLGVEERKTGDGSEIYLRASRDLVHWTEGVPIPGTKAVWSGGFHYPVFYDKNFSDSTAVDPNGFYIGASTGNAKIVLRYIELEIKTDD